MKILMVCLGNICRSPMAQGIMQQQSRAVGLDWNVQSAGTSGWHNGEPPDRRAIAMCRTHGIDISHQRSRAFEESDFEDYDLILTMDRDNLRDVLYLAENEQQRSKVRPIIDWSDDPHVQSIPDPYYDDSFDRAFSLLDMLCQKIVVEYG